MHWVTWGTALLAVAIGASLLAETLAESRDRARNPAPGQLVDVGGHRLHLLCKPAPPGTDGPTVVIEQGVGSPSILWWPIQDRISAFARVCTYDRAGYQWSDPAPGPQTLQDRVTDLHTLLHKAAIPGPYVLAGHSFGGPLTRLYTSTYPNDVAALVLVDAAPEAVIFRPSFDAYTAKIGLFVRAAGLAARLGVVRLAASFLLKPSDTMSPDALRALKSFIAAPAFFRAMAADLPALAQVPADMRREGGFGQTLGDRPVIALTHSEPFPGPAAVLEDGWEEAQHRIAAQSTRGEVHIATGCNHMIPFEKPDLVVEAIRRVLDELHATPTMSPIVHARL